MASTRGSTAAACSFCGKLQSSVEKIIAGPNGVYICNECIDLCNDIIAEQLVESTTTEPSPTPPLPAPPLAVSLETVRRELQALTNQVRRLAERAEAEPADTEG